MFIRYLKRGWYVFALWACRMFCVVFFRMHMNGQENVPAKGSFLLICNHQSALDPIFCGAPLRRQMAYLARDTLFRNMAFGAMIASVGTIPIRRDSADLSAIKRMLGKLKQGYGLCLFPEGTRTSDGRIQPLKSGFSLLSRKTKSPIVPVVIDGAFQAWPRTKKFFSMWQHVIVWYGKPIKYEEIEKMTDEELAVYVTKVMRDMLNECRENFGHEPYSYDDMPAEGILSGGKE